MMRLLSQYNISEWEIQLHYLKQNDLSTNNTDKKILYRCYTCDHLPDAFAQITTYRHGLQSVPWCVSSNLKEVFSYELHNFSHRCQKYWAFVVFEMEECFARGSDFRKKANRHNNDKTKTVASFFK
jgi:hypothetical protein